MDQCHHPALAAEETLEEAATRRSPARLRRGVTALMANIGDTPGRWDELRRAALAWDAHFRLHGDAASIDIALGYARTALAGLKADAPRIRRVAFLDTLANVLYHKGEKQLDPAALDEAEALFERALDVADRRADAAIWCIVANSLASVHATRHRLTNDETSYRTGRDLYRTVRSVAARAGLFAEWTDAAGNILRMERDIVGDRGDDGALARIEHRMRRVLRVRLAGHPEGSPAALRHLLAVTLAIRADIVYRRDLLEEARELWRLNLAEWPRKRSEQEWARTTNSIAILDLTIGEREQSAAALQRAMAALASIADFPSLRRARPRGTPRPPWRLRTTPESYVHALTNMATARLPLAAMTRTPALVYDFIADLEDARRRSFVDEALAATILALLAKARLTLAQLLPRPGRMAESEAQCHAAALVLRQAGHDVMAANLLSELGQGLQEQARWPDARAAFAGARAALLAACEAAGTDPAADALLSARRWLAHVDLRSAGWEGDLVAARALTEAVEADRLRMAGRLPPVHDLQWAMLAADAGAVVARLDGRPDAYARLEATLDILLVRPDLSRLDALRFRIALGHARLARGHVDAAIEAWSAAQATLWSLVLAQGEAALGAATTCAVGRTGRDLMAGGGLSLADELALSLLRRGAPGDVDRALASIERGRAVAPSLHRGGEAAVIALRDQLREVEALERRYAAAAFDEGRDAVHLARLGHRKRELMAALAEAVAGRTAQGLPQIDLSAIVAALPQGAAACVVILAERGAAIVVIGRDAGGEPRNAAVLLDALDRAVVDRLLLGDSRDEAGFLDAVETLAGLAGPSLPSQAQFQGTVDGFSARLAAGEAALAPRLLEPVRKALVAMFGALPRRLCWLVPGALWPLPLHAMRVTGVAMPAVQSYARTLGEMVDLARHQGRAARPPRRALVVDNPRGDMAAESPFPIESPPGGAFVVDRLPGARATRTAILKRMALADLFLFHGHGRYLRGDRDRTGLAIAGRASDVPLRPGDPEPGILSIHALQGLAIGLRDIAVLSACDVGAIDLQTDIEDFSGLPSELLAAGFACVVAATWPVEQAATAVLMRAFVAALPATYGDPAVALAEAATQLRATSDGRPARAMQAVGGAAPPGLSFREERTPDSHADPYWWAGFRFIGF